MATFLRGVFEFDPTFGTLERMRALTLGLVVLSMAGVAQRSPAFLTSAGLHRIYFKVAK
jgi:hypothetical protein